MCEENGLTPVPRQGAGSGAEENEALLVEGINRANP